MNNKEIAKQINYPKRVGHREKGIDMKHNKDFRFAIILTMLIKLLKMNWR